MLTIAEIVIERLKKEHPESVIGSLGKKSKEALEKRNPVVRDLDLLVMDSKYAVFHREVFQEEGLEFDISYISEELLRDQLQVKSRIWVDAIKGFSTLYTGDPALSLGITDLKKQVKKMEAENPKGILHQTSDAEIRFIRFDLSQKLKDLFHQKEDKVQFNYLKNSYVIALIENYFQLWHRMIPKRKKQLKQLSGEEPELYQMIQDFYEADSEQAYEVLEKMTEYVLKHVGGGLQTFEKDVYPIDR